MWLILRRKKWFYYLSHFTALKKKFFKNPNFLLDLFFSNLLRKTNVLSLSEILSEVVIFDQKERFSVTFPKMLKKKKKDFLAVCVSFWGEKQFSFLIVQFYCFEQKGLFITNPNFPLDFPLFKLVEKNKPSMFFWPFFWDSHFFD